MYTDYWIMEGEWEADHHSFRIGKNFILLFNFFDLSGPCGILEDGLLYSNAKK